jgi:purine-cytosine permease-like protein|tara:strand:- start:856 stop:1644 length:789 start_codon:yes stop_codon:yes gene_type:complete
VWTGNVVEDRNNFTRFTFAHCAVFAWFCDLTLHIGQVDLTIMRYARSPTMGWASIGGMVLGHYITWIIAGVMYAVQLQADPALTSVAPGPIADRIAGVFGVIAVIIAGFSTASPVLYAGSLAAQHAFPRAPLWKVTLVVGGLASVAALFPALVARMLELLGICGLLLMPLGVILFVDFWILPRLGIASEVAHAQGGKTNVAAAAAWAATSTICLPIALFTPADVFFTPLLGIPLAGGLYVALSLAVNRKHTVEAQSSRQRPK